MQPTDFPAVEIHPDSVILADQEGVVSFDPANLEAVIELCTKANAVDAKCMMDLRNGRSIKDTFKEHRGK
jgi:regulator of RNase E activity RraA